VVSFQDNFEYSEGSSILIDKLEQNYFDEKPIIALKIEESIAAIISWENQYNQIAEKPAEKTAEAPAKPALVRHNRVSSAGDLKPLSRKSTHFTELSKRPKSEIESENTAPEQGRKSRTLPKQKSVPALLSRPKSPTNLPKPAPATAAPTKVRFHENAKISHDASNNGNKFKTPSTIRKPEIVERKTSQTSRVTVNGKEYTVRRKIIFLF